MYDPKWKPGTHRASRILAVVAFGGLDITIASDYVHKKDNLTKEFQEKFPTQLVPAFETKDGECISETSAIAWYLASYTSLLPSSPILQSQILQWQSFTDTDLLSAINAIYGSVSGYIPGSEELLQFHHKRALNALRKLDDYLAKGGRKFLVGDVMTLADLTVVGGLTRGYAALFDAPVQARYPHVLAYYLSIIRLQVFQEVWGDNVLVDKCPIDVLNE